ncbi:MAG: sulfite exporter TauE/SafE family protein [Planctomycetota bacterium]
MDFLQFNFPVSGVETLIFIPPLVAFIISFFTSMGGISGAFLILPFQVSVLGFVTPSVSSTNFLYNVVGTPGGVVRYVREKRMVWPLAVSLISGALPGVLMGYYVRVKYLPDPKAFKLFVGLVLLGIGLRLIKDFNQQKIPKQSTTVGSYCISRTDYNFNRITFDFRGDNICFSLPAVLILAFIVGIVGGVYGIGGGAIIAPFCISVLNIPVFTVAGAVLLGNFMTSLAGLVFYSSIPLHNGQTAPPDWILGLLFGVGGILGMYFGAKCQRYMPEKFIKIILTFVILTVSAKYIVQFF